MMPLNQRKSNPARAGDLQHASSGVPFSKGFPLPAAIADTIPESADRVTAASTARRGMREPRLRFATAGLMAFAVTQSIPATMDEEERGAVAVENLDGAYRCPRNNTNGEVAVVACRNDAGNAGPMTVAVGIGSSNHRHVLDDVQVGNA